MQKLSFVVCVGNEIAFGPVRVYLKDRNNKKKYFLVEKKSPSCFLISLDDFDKKMSKPNIGQNKLDTKSFCVQLSQTKVFFFYFLLESINQVIKTLFGI